MKIGIIVHSFTGNTLKVAEKLKEELISIGHNVKLEQVTAVNEDPKQANKVELKNIPDVSSYDAVIFGCPVRGFSLSPVMKLYLSQVSSLKGKKISCFVTHHFPFAWMGGNSTIKQFKAASEAKEGVVTESGIVNWSSKNREKNILEVVERLSKF